MSMLFVEAAIGTIALFVWGLAQESPGQPYSTMGLILISPFVAAAEGVLCALLTVGVVMPLLVVAGWLGRRLSGRKAWWWIPALTATATALPFLAAVTLGATGLLAGLGGWLTVTAALATTALVTRRLLLPDRPQLSGGAMFGRVALYGTLAVVTAGTLAAIGLYSGIEYEPPRRSAERIAGTWSDGMGGTLILTTIRSSSSTSAAPTPTPGTSTSCNPAAD
ncbi:hypothetical protein [Streptomyces sp. NPDC059278]|uniref:hypothetical protein n=1 Tax=Streptomyces sp. NPDC059278 TaxID=3346801 RepID=UPI0036ACBD63